MSSWPTTGSGGRTGRATTRRPKATGTQGLEETGALGGTSPCSPCSDGELRLRDSRKGGGKAEAGAPSRPLLASQLQEPSIFQERKLRLNGGPFAENGDGPEGCGVNSFSPLP